MNKYDTPMVELRAELNPYLSAIGPKLLTPDDITPLEADIGYSLPSDYREFLRDYGGFSVWASYRFKNPTPPWLSFGSIRTFYGLFPGHPLDIEENRYWLLASQVLLPCMLPIAEGAAGNQICISLSAEDYGVIYYWERETAGEPADRSNLYVIADTFDEFINSLFLID